MKNSDIREMVLAAYFWKHQVRVFRPKNGLAGRNQSLALSCCDDYKNARRMLRNANARLAKYCRSQAAGWNRNGSPIGFYDKEPE